MQDNNTIELQSNTWYVSGNQHKYRVKGGRLYINYDVFVSKEQQQKKPRLKLSLTAREFIISHGRGSEEGQTWNVGYSSSRSPLPLPCHPWEGLTLRMGGRTPTEIPAMGIAREEEEALFFPCLFPSISPSNRSHRLTGQNWVLCSFLGCKVHDCF